MGPAFTMQTMGKPLIPKYWVALPVAVYSDSVGRRQKYGQPRSTTLISFSDGQRQAPHAGASKPKWRTVRQRASWLQCGAAGTCRQTKPSPLLHSHVLSAIQVLAGC